MLGMMDIHDCMLACHGDSGVEEPDQRGVFGLFQPDMPHFPQSIHDIAKRYAHIRRTIHGILFLDRVGVKILTYRLCHYLVWNPASNIGSVASITGNPQNMLIGSFSGIAYRDFLLHLGPVAVVGLFLDWMVLHWMHMRKVQHGELVNDGIPLPPLDLSRLTKPAIVVTAVLIGFFAGVPP